MLVPNPIMFIELIPIMLTRASPAVTTGDWPVCRVPKAHGKGVVAHTTRKDNLGTGQQGP